MAAGEVNSVASAVSGDLFNALPADIQKLAVKNYQLWRSNPHHPSLHFRRLQGSTDRFSVRVGVHNRALGRLQANTIGMGLDRWYDRLTGS